MKFLFRCLSPALISGVIFLGPSANAQDSCASERASVNTLQEKVQRDQQAIRNLGFNIRASEFEEWGKIGQEAKEQTLKNFANVAISAAFAGIKNAIKTPGKYNPASLNPWNVNTRIKELTNTGLNVKPIEKYLRIVAAQKDKRDKMMLATEIIEKSNDLQEMSWDLKLDAAFTFATWFTKSPQVGLGQMIGSAVVGSAFAAHTRFITKPELERLTKLTEEELRNLNTLTTLLQTDTRELKNAKAQLASCMLKTIEGTWVITSCSGPNAERLIGNVIQIQSNGGSYQLQQGTLTYTVSRTDNEFSAVAISAEGDLAPDIAVAVRGRVKPARFHLSPSADPDQMQFTWEQDRVKGKRFGSKVQITSIVRELYSGVLHRHSE